MADVIRFGDYADVKPVIDQLDNMTRAINVTREMLSIFKPQDRFEIIASVLASEACDYAGTNACWTNAVHKLGECYAGAVTQVAKTFPPFEEGFPL